MSRSVGSNAGTRHKSVQALLSTYPGEGDPKVLIRRLARRKVADAKSKGWSGPPFCPKQLASLSGVRCKEVGHDIDGDGRILPYPGNRIWIEYCAGRMRERQRFTILHELAHTLFPDFGECLPLHQPGNKAVRDPEKEFENLCDIAASEMLFPHEDFLRDLAGLSWKGLESIHILRCRYDASIDATTHRLVEVVPDLACAAAFLTDQKGIFKGRGPLWVKYATHQANFKGYIQPGVVVPSYSVALQCYRGQVDATAPTKEVWWPYGKPRTWLVQAASLPAFPENPEYPKVVAMLFPSGYKHVLA